MAKSKVALAALTALSSALLIAPAFAQNYPITPAQRATANQVAQKGVPLSELAPNAPDRYTIKSGDTLWDISKLYLKSPWRWPELWGMNLDQIKNPHRIYPGQVLVLERADGRATLRIDDGGLVPADINTVRVSPRNRLEALPDSALPTLRPSVIEPFLAEPIIVDALEFAAAPRIVSAQEGRVLLTRGDRAYARGQNGMPLLDDQQSEKIFRVFRTATPLKDPETGAVLGYEAIYAGKAKLKSSETTSEEVDASGKVSTAIVPARIDIISAKEEIRVGDRLLPEPPRDIRTYTPHAPQGALTGRIVSVYGSAVENAAQNQVVVINKGKLDGVDSGTVLAILKNGARIIDKQDEARPLLKLPDERNGLMMVFRTFDHLSYALILDITDGVRVGDRLASPR
ncbi:LysM peptidoglycan-binding domain-containing protein [Rhodoferax sp. GW822-FHT02A01]|uniref:LysM peptidoglycan-binding domain-containing protein n=1 Tax=Rhodoferax sp. GW822-FHT02A01 TaxID=3141537 RepID=UPI00315C5326